MRFTPHTSADQERMLHLLGLKSVEELYRHIPESLRSRARIDLPEGLSELTVRRRLSALAAKNADASQWTFFLGGGVYQHFIPSAVDAIVSRAEFLTSYTPYQPEVSQGTLQTLYEYQTLICQLTGMEVSNAAVYDGASAAAEAVLMSRRIQSGKRRQVLLSRALHPHYRESIATYLKNLEDVSLEEIGFDSRGGTDLDQLAVKINEQTLCVVVGYPNFFGVIEDLSPLKAACVKAGTHLITVTTEPLALAMLKPPGSWGADIAVGEGQSLGVPMNLGGPGYGFFACQKKFVRNMPGRLVGETVDSDGKRGFVLTLATREQHIRREKATSNICTSQTLCAIASTVFMSLMGKSGLRRLAEINLARAHAAQRRLIEAAKAEAVFAAPFFNEFVIRVKNSDDALRRCATQKIIPGIALEKIFPELKNCLLVCVTELNEAEEVEAVVRALAT